MYLGLTRTAQSRGCVWLFGLLMCHINLFLEGVFQCEAKGLLCSSNQTCTWSQNGYGDHIWMSCAWSRERKCQPGEQSISARLGQLQPCSVFFLVAVGHMLVSTCWLKFWYGDLASVLATKNKARNPAQSRRLVRARLLLCQRPACRFRTVQKV